MDIILKPFSWLLTFFYQFAGYGVALILFGFVVKLILFPVTLKQKKSMIQMNMLSGRVQKLQAQYGKTNPQRYQEEVQKLYAQEKVNPMGGCAWSLVPMVVLIALYGIIRNPIQRMMGVPADMIDTVAKITGVENTGAYPQIAMARALGDPNVLASAKQALGEAGDGLFAMNFTFLGLDLDAIPTWRFWEGGIHWATLGLFLLVLVSTLVSFLSMKVSMQINNQTQNAQMDQTNKTMMLMMPLMSLWIGFTVPAALSVYWISQYLMTMVQEVVCGKMLKKDYEAARAAVCGAPYPLDVGRHNDRYFAYVASFGAFTRSSYSATQAAKNALGHFAYILEGLGDLDSLRPYRCAVEADGEHFEGEFIFGAVCNSTSLGGLVKLDPACVRMDDGMFELLLLRMPKSALDLQNLINVMTRMQYDYPGVILRHVRHVTVTTDEELPWSLDGEYCPSAPRVEIENLPAAVQLMH